ncbi:MAG TPA: hypothetical protein VLN45_01095, partial [Ignavibacteriaceae bacterium]|nr:hypothetical protein [Ignavibacteriaceae bacterium]
MKLKFLYALIIFSINIYSQKLVEEYQRPEGYLRIGPDQEQMIPMVEKGFTLILPEIEVKAVVIVPSDERFNFKEAVNKEGSFEYEAMKKGIAVIHTISGNPIDFYFTSDIMSEIVKELQFILEDNNLKELPVYFWGISLAGTRALKLTIFLQTNKEKFWLQSSGVAISEAPLDMVRYWDVLNRTMINDFSPDDVKEAKEITYLLKENLGTPQENFNNYVDYSPFMYISEDGGNATDLRNIPFRAYYDPDV